MSRVREFQPILDAPVHFSRFYPDPTCTVADPWCSNCGNDCKDGYLTSKERKYILCLTCFRVLSLVNDELPAKRKATQFAFGAGFDAPSSVVSTSVSSPFNIMQHTLPNGFRVGDQHVPGRFTLGVAVPKPGFMFGAPPYRSPNEKAQQQQPQPQPQQPHAVKPDTNGDDDPPLFLKK
jgi:hypothetical protein